MQTEYKGFQITDTPYNHPMGWLEPFTITDEKGRSVVHQDEETISECYDTIDEIIKSEPEPLSIEDLEYNALEERGQKERNGEWAYDLR